MDHTGNCWNATYLCCGAWRAQRRLRAGGRFDRHQGERCIGDQAAHEAGLRSEGRGQDHLPSRLLAQHHGRGHDRSGLRPWQPLTRRLVEMAEAFAEKDVASGFEKDLALARERADREPGPGAHAQQRRWRGGWHGVGAMSSASR